VTLKRQDHNVLIFEVYYLGTRALINHIKEITDKRRQFNYAIQWAFVGTLAGTVTRRLSSGGKPTAESVCACVRASDMR